MRRTFATLLKKWIVRQLTFAPLLVFLAIGFRSGAHALTPEARWHPAFKWAGPLAVCVLVCLQLRWLPFDPMALGMLLFLIVGAAGVLGLRHGMDAIHLVYTPLAQTMLFVWILIVFCALACRSPGLLLGLAPAPTSTQAKSRMRWAAWALVAVALMATGASWLLRAHELWAGLLPFLSLMVARHGARRYAQGSRP